MNTWTEKSFELAKEKGYLDKIFKIYPVEQNGSENLVDDEMKEKIKEFLNNKNAKDLIAFLITFKRFPFDEPYLGFLRHFNEALEKNPKTKERILIRLQKIGIQGIIDGINRPKSASRKFGKYFSFWIQNNFKVLEEKEFLIKNQGIYVLKGGDKKLANYARKYLKYDRKKGLDFVIKVNNIHVIGEAKFVSHSGGTQDKSVREVVNLVKDKKPTCILVGLIDGVPWVSNSTLSKSLHDLKEDQYIMSALFFKEFLQNSSL